MCSNIIIKKAKQTDPNKERHLADRCSCRSLLEVFYNRKRSNQNEGYVDNVENYNHSTKTCGGNQTALICGQAAIAMGPPIMFNQAPDVTVVSFMNMQSLVLIVQPCSCFSQLYLL